VLQYRRSTNVMQASATSSADPRTRDPRKGRHYTDVLRDRFGTNARNRRGLSTMVRRSTSSLAPAAAPTPSHPSDAQRRVVNREA
jgi:hypothetical protein